jgi:pimeloyl-ACP methyl ester carboxylesterase
MKYLLPGMGATSSMYSGPWLSLSDSHALDWPEYRGETRIADVADRLIDEHGICSSDRIVGSSLGGIVALEIHHRISLRQVILVGSAVVKEEINSLLLAAAPLAKITPLRLIQCLAGKGFNEVSAMFADVDADFVRAMCLDVNRWEGYCGSLEAVSRIHGERDPVIKCPNDAHIITGGGHLIAMTHARECVAIINEFCC